MASDSEKLLNKIDAVSSAIQLEIESGDVGATSANAMIHALEILQNDRRLAESNLLLQMRLGNGEMSWFVTDSWPLESSAARKLVSLDKHVQSIKDRIRSSDI